ncbi:hypothetical protein GCM10010420_33270 [Streptomyces glaucosporus]|uniref:DUF4236 domain-containing protein n=2 Tax=Streptomyces glaucosporus TaxID=284044 RepID=A0ABN3IGT2_9ACTN
MPLYFRKRITIVPGLVRLTFGPRGWSLTVGPRRAHITLDRHGNRGATAHLPGGLTWHRGRSRR